MKHNTAKQTALDFFMLEGIECPYLAQSVAREYVEAGKTPHAESCRRGRLERFGVVSVLRTLFVRADEVAKWQRRLGSNNKAYYFDSVWERSKRLRLPNVC